MAADEWVDGGKYYIDAGGKWQKGAVKYDLWIAGVEVTKANRADILGNGVFSFDGDHTLSIHGDYSKDMESAEEACLINCGMSGLVINVTADSNIEMKNSGTGSTCILVSADTTITGEGKLTLDTDAIAIQAKGSCGTLKLDHLSLLVKYAQRGISGEKYGAGTKLFIDSSDVEVKYTIDDCAVLHFDSITLTGCQITAPSDAEISEYGAIADSIGEPTYMVKITKTS